MQTQNQFLPALYCVLLLSFFVFGFSTAFHSDDHELNLRFIRLKSGHVDTTHTSLPNWKSKTVQEIQSLAEQTTRKETFFVHVHEAFTAADKSLLEESLGLKLDQYLPHNTFIVHLHPSQWLNAGESMKHVLWIGQVQPEHKVSPSMMTRLERRVSSHVSLQVLLSEQQQDTELLADIWSESIAPLLPFGAEAEVRDISSTRISIAVFSYDDEMDVSPIATQIVQYLSTQTEVLWVEDKLPGRFFNAHAHGVAQSGAEDYSPIWEADLTGDGEIIGVGDSGLDFYRCAFEDGDKLPASVRSPNDTLKDNGHRKVSGYWTYMDEYDDFHGHGTHVMGTIAGQTQSNAAGSKLLSQYNGMAYNARLLLTDIGCQTKGGCECLDANYCSVRCPNEVCKDSDRETYEPDDLNAYFFPFSYEHGARIHSNSWGEETDGEYRLSSQGIDQFSWDHKDFLPVFAAANSGRNGLYSMSTEGAAKNALTVGASMTTNEGFIDSVHYIDFEARVASVQKYLKEEGYNEWEAFNSTTVCCDSPQACKFMNKTDDGCFALTCCPQRIINNQKQNKNHFNENNLAQFSSFGPTHDGRIKPDVTAPGVNIISTASQGTENKVKCGAVDAAQELVPKSGTSMATPVTAGNTALVREFYRKGYYPSGKPNDKDGFTPSAALLKATMINSARTLSGMLELNQENGGWKNITQLPSFFGHPVPSPYQGWGRFTLNNVLPLGNNTNFSLIVANTTDPELNTGDHHTYCIKGDGTQPATITLVWTDYPSSPAAAVNLVNNLDLAVFSSDFLLLGNGKWAVDAQQRAYQIPDRLNNVETVFIPRTPNGVFSVMVNGTHVPQGPQAYALVLTGGVSMESSNNCKDTPPHNLNENSVNKGMMAGLIASASLAGILAVAVVILTIVVFKLRSSNTAYRAI